MQNNNLLLVVILMLFANIFNGQEKSVSYSKLYDLFNSYSENDQRAMVFVNMYIAKAKDEGNLRKLIAGYEEAIYYTPSADRKLIYGDSAIASSVRLNDNDEIARSHLGKGIIYYYNKRSYRKALEEYLLAFKSVKDSEDEYLKNKVTYHLAIVKSYLGYYDEASKHFLQTADYFEKNMIRKDIHSNTRLNYESGYYNSIYRLSKCYYDMKWYKREDSLIENGLRRMKSVDEHPIEYAYFQKGKGIQLIRQEKYGAALRYLNVAKNILDDKEDFASLATVNFYLGISHWNMEMKDESVIYFNKVDSLVNKFSFITPEIRPTYKYLIRYATDKKDSEKLLYYTNQLIKGDSILIADFPNLSLKIKYGYDAKNSQDEKQRLIDDKKNARLLVSILSVSSVIIIIIIFYRSNAKQKKLKSQYRKLLIKIQQDREKVHMSSSVGESDSSYGQYFAGIGSSRLSDFKNPDTNDHTENLPTKSLDQNAYDHYDKKNVSDSFKDKAEDSDDIDHSTNELNHKYDPQMINGILEKLKIFEEEKKYLQKNLKMPDVAAFVGTNRSTLSYIINEHLKIPYPDYIKTLRIRYITELMVEDKKYLKYKIKSLADICGVSSRQVFSLQFRQVNGMSPTDFMSQRLKDLKDQ